MEERIIDDEYGRGIRLRKTADGYVDVTDELAEHDAEEKEVNYDEISFEFPELDEDDEDLVSLSPEEALALRKRKAEEAENRRRQYEHICEEGERLLDSGSFHTAELKFETALNLDPYRKEAVVGYWRAKTANFTNPNALMDEYVEIGIENLEADLGYEAVEDLKALYPEVFAARLKELQDECAPIREEVYGKRENRRKVISKKLKTATIRLAISSVITAALLVAAIVLGTKIFSTREGEFILPTIITGVVFAVALTVSLVFTNQYLNVMRIHRLNERDDSTELGRKLSELLNYIELYEAFATPTVESESELDEMGVQEETDADLAE